VKDATAMADDLWRKMTKQEQDKLVKIKRNFSSGLSDVDVTPLVHNFSFYKEKAKCQGEDKKRKKVDVMERKRQEQASTTKTCSKPSENVKR
jgi:hypothetical protein